jgi:hypothetical protein
VDFLGPFTEAWETRKVALNAELFADDVRLAGVAHKPFEGKEATLAVFAMLRDVLDELEYVGQYDGPGGVILRVRGVVGGRTFDGVQILTLDDDGLIVECLDLIRPHSAGVALLEASAKYLEAQAQGD